MHPNKAFHTQDDDANLTFAADRAFGTLSVQGDDAPLVSHIPFLVRGDQIWMHLLRSNPIARALPARACLAVTGPDSYISPDWYGVLDQVPTWNYIAVHIRGVLELLPAEDLRSVLDAQTAHFEAKLAPKLPWKTDKMTPEVLERMMRSIIPARITIESVEGTWKLNQNKDDAARLSASSSVEAHGLGSEVAQLAKMMRNV